MKKIGSVFLLLIISSLCCGSILVNNFDAESTVYSKTYTQTKQDILQQRNKLQNSTIEADSLATIFTNNLVDRLIPYWYGTTWTFDGHTSVPNTGSVACGYFVSTTLKDMGLNLNRYKLAQQLPINEAYSIAVDNQVLKIENSDNLVCQNQLYNQLKEGVYFIGFDKNHVGYIYKKEDQLYIIDANFFSKKVQIEKIESSKVFALFNTFYITPISTNKTLMNYWLKNQEIKIITSKG